MRRLSSIVLVVCALFLASCGQVAQKAVEQTTGVKTSQDGDAVTITGKDGESATISSQLADELKDFPVPQGFKLDSSGSMSSGGGKLAVATWVGPGTLQSVADFYTKTMPSQGWKEDSNFSSSDGGMLNYSKGDQGGVTITTSLDGDKVTISVLYGKDSEKPASAAGQSNAGQAATPGAQAVQTAPTVAPEAPETTDASALPAELKDLPVPSGFAVVKDSAMRSSEGGKFSSASATWFGKLSVKETGAFLQKEIPAQNWTEESFSEGEGNISADYFNEKEGLRLYVHVYTADAGTEISLELLKE